METNKNNEKFVENIIISGDNFRPYKYCVHVFEADIKNAAMVQSNDEKVMKNIMIALVEKYGEGVCEKQSPYLLKIARDFNDDFIREMNLIVNKVIRDFSNDTKPIFKMYEKEAAMNENADRLPTIIIW